MTTPTPAPTPDVNNTGLAEDENAAQGGSNPDAEFSDQEGQDPDNVSPDQDASKNEESTATPLFNTDTGQSGV